MLHIPPPVRAAPRAFINPKATTEATSYELPYTLPCAVYEFPHLLRILALSVDTRSVISFSPYSHNYSCM